MSGDGNGGKAIDAFTGPREVSDLGHNQVDAHDLLSDGTGAITVSDVPTELQERWGHGALPGFRNFIAAATSVFDWAGEGAEELDGAFGALPEQIQMAVVDQLAIAPASKSQLKPADPQYVSEFASTDFGSFVFEVWGARRTPYNLALVDKRITYILGNLDAQDQETLLSWFDSIHPQDAAAVYLALSGTD